MKKNISPQKAMLHLANSLNFNLPSNNLNKGLSFSLFKVEILSGLTVALALVPEAIAFAFVAGVAPLSGLYAAFIVGLITAVFGGRPGMISGATGALAVVMVSLVMDHDPSPMKPSQQQGHQLHQRSCQVYLQIQL